MRAALHTVECRACGTAWTVAVDSTGRVFWPHVEARRSAESHAARHNLVVLPIDGNGADASPFFPATGETLVRGIVAVTA